MARDTQAPPELPPQANRPQASAGLHGRAPRRHQIAGWRTVSIPDRWRPCHDARSGDTTAGWLAGEEIPGEPGRRARQPAVGDRLAQRRPGHLRQPDEAGAVAVEMRDREEAFLAGESRLKQDRMRTADLPGSRKASDKPSDNDPRSHQTGFDALSH
jgi:hypothetical protein